jgi:hypothetical protein
MTAAARTGRPDPPRNVLAVEIAHGDDILKAGRDEWSRISAVDSTALPH